MEVKLSAPQLANCRSLALQRSTVKRQAGVQNRKLGPGTDFEYDYLGLRGETALGTLFDLPVDESTALCGDGGHWDFRIAGVTISLKTRSKGTWTLIPAHQRPPKADILVCAEQVTEDSIRFVGWCLGEHWDQLKEDVDVPCLKGAVGIRDSKLRQMDELVQIISELRSVAAGV